MKANIIGILIMMLVSLCLYAHNTYACDNIRIKQYGYNMFVIETCDTSNPWNQCIGSWWYKAQTNNLFDARNIVQELCRYGIDGKIVR